MCSQAILLSSPEAHSVSPSGFDLNMAPSEVQHSKVTRLGSRDSYPVSVFALGPLSKNVAGAASMMSKVDLRRGCSSQAHFETSERLHNVVNRKG